MSNFYSKENPPSGFYVYAYLRDDGSPYYIGKGIFDRMFRSHKSHGIYKPRQKENWKIVVLECNLSEIGALALERFYIRWYGRKDLKTGILHNKTDGGEGVSGYSHTEESKKKMRRKFTEEHKRKLSEARKGIAPPNKGKKMSDDMRRLISIRTKDAMNSPHMKEKLSIANKSVWKREGYKQKMSDLHKTISKK